MYIVASSWIQRASNSLSRPGQWDRSIRSDTVAGGAVIGADGTLRELQLSALERSVLQGSVWVEGVGSAASLGGWAAACKWVHFFDFPPPAPDLSAFFRAPPAHAFAARYARRWGRSALHAVGGCFATRPGGSEVAALTGADLFLMATSGRGAAGGRVAGMQ